MLKYYAEAVKTRCFTPGIWAFIDGTIRPMCRPGEVGSEVHQQDYYIGYKKYHGFKYQGILTPDGLLSCLIGPFSAKFSDWKAWYYSRVEVELKRIM